MFRTEDTNKALIQKDNTEACPFKSVEYAFSYSTRSGAKVCENPPSRLDTCIDNTKMVFQFQACPDVPGSERTGKQFMLFIDTRGKARFARLPLDNWPKIFGLVPGASGILMW